MPTALNQINAESRKEMICPSCHERGLKEAPKYAAQCGNSKKQRIIYATACTNPECEYYASEDKSARIPAEKIKRQYSPSSSRTLPFNWSIARVTIGVIAVIGIVGLLFSTGGILSDGSGAAEASPTLNETDDGVTKIDTQSPWTIYKSNGEYYIVGKRDGDIVYLNKDGEVVSSLVTFEEQGIAEDAVRQWQARQDQGLTNGTVKQVPDDYIGGSQWTVYERNGTAFIAAERNGEIVYINSSLGIQDSPYFYDNTSEARETLIEFESSPSGLVDSSDWEFIEYGGDIIVGATPDSGPRDGETVFLQPDGTVSTDPYHYDSETEANDALDNFDGWDSVDRDTIDFDGDDDDNDSGGDTTANVSQADSGSVQTDLDGSNIDGREQTGGDSQAGTVQGSVTDSNGEPVEGATVHLYSNHYTTTTDENGSYEFTDIPTGEHQIHIEPPAGSGLTATENTTFTLTQDGITTVEDNPSSSYFKQDGLVSQNRINFNPRTEQPIKITGEGTNTSATVAFANSRNADDISVKLTDKYTSGISTQKISSSTDQDVVSITGTADPKTQAVAVDAEPVSSAQSATFTDGDTFTRKGNIAGENATVELRGQTVTNQRSVSGTGTSQITNRGNTDSNAEITVVGSEVTNHRTVTNSGTAVVTNNGNIDAPAEVTIYGQEKNLGTQTKRASLSDGESITIEVDGDVPAENVQLDLTGQTDLNHFETLEVDCYRNKYDESYERDCSVYDTTYRTYTIDDEQHLLKAEYDLWVYADAHTEPYGVVDAELALEKESQQYDYTTGTIATAHAKTNESNGGDIATTKGSKLFYREGGENVRLTLDYDFNNANYYSDISYEGTVQLYGVDGPDDTTVSVDGRQADSVNLKAKQTKTVNLGTLEPGTHTIQVDTTGDTGVDVIASWDEKRAVRDLSVDTDGDSNAEIVRSSPLTEEDSITTTTTLSPGENQISVDSSGPVPTLDTEFTERTASADVAVGVASADSKQQVSSLLREGETKTVKVGLSPGEQKLEFSHTGPAPTWQAKITERSTTKSPTATIGQGEISEDGFLRPNETITVPGDRLGAKTYQVKADSASGPPPVVTIDYTAKAIAEEAKVSINGNEYHYPEAYDGSGRLTRQTDEINISSLTVGNNDVSVSATPVDGIETAATATLRYPSESLQTSQPTVHVIQPDGAVKSKPVPQEALSDGQLKSPYEMSLEQQAFGDGSNTIVVETPDGSLVGIEVTGTSSTPQSDIFEPTAEIPHNASLP